MRLKDKQLCFPLRTIRTAIPDMTHSKESGIYRITIGDKFYIGSAVSLVRRFYTHINSLRRNKHKNPIMQALFDKYGEKCFVFEVIELCDKSELIQREQHYIDTLNPYINICRLAGSNFGVKFSEESILKMRLAQGRKVYQYSLDGNFIREWDSASFAAEHYKIDHSGILKCCNGLFKRFHEYIWSYEKSMGIPNYVNPRFKAVNQYDTQFNLLASYSSVLEAAKSLQVRQSFISRICAEGRGKVKGFYLSYADCAVDTLALNNRCATIFVYDTSMVLVGEYTDRDVLCRDFDLKINDVARHLNSRKGKPYKGLLLSYEKLTA